MVQITRQILHN